MNESPYCYSAHCSWHGPISAVGKTESSPNPVKVKRGGREITIPNGGIPCCPFCGSVLFQVRNKLEWDSGAIIHEQKGHTNYVAFLGWTRVQERCWPSLRDAAVDYSKETGKLVKFDL
jgi:hypothetical protein